MDSVRAAWVVLGGLCTILGQLAAILGSVRAPCWGEGAGQGLGVRAFAIKRKDCRSDCLSAPFTYMGEGGGQRDLLQGRSFFQRGGKGGRENEC